MKAVIDANVLMQIIGVIGNGLYCPKTGAEVTNPEGRAEALLERFSPRGWQLLIPAPVLAEAFVKIDKQKHQEYISAINAVTSVSIVPFDAKCATECARLVDAQEVKQLQSEGDTKAKIAVDRQVVSIAVANSADEVWTHDKQVYKKAKKLNMRAMSLADIEPMPKQHAMFEDAEQAS